MIKEETKAVILDGSINDTPRFKGRTKIELFENGEKVAEHIDENMQTNFINNVFNMPRMYAIGDAGYKVISDNTPIYDKLLGGLLLYADAVDEDADNILVSVDNECIGHAGASYSGTNKRRGSYNNNESGYIDSNKKWLGYRHVWDFGTDKANGVISCACLTTKIGGNSGFGGGISFTANETNNEFAEATTNGFVGVVANSSQIFAPSSFRFLGNFDGISKFAYIRDNSHVVVLECNVDNMNLNLADNFGSDVVTAQSFDFAFANNSEKPNARLYDVALPFAIASSNAFSVFVDSGNYYIVNQSSTSGFDFVVLDGADVTLSGATSISVSPSYLNTLANNVVKSGSHWFAVNSNKTLIRYAEGGGQGEEFGTLPFFYSSAQPMGEDVAFLQLNNSSDSHFCVANAENPEIKMYKSAGIVAGYSAYQIDGNYILSWNISNANNRIQFTTLTNRISGCMATINNLTTPITKTSAQTMKITYEVTAEGVE